MLTRLRGSWLLTCLLLATTQAAMGSAAFPPSSCMHCHEQQRQGQSPIHARECTLCHAGDPLALTQEGAHRGLIRFPGDLSNAAKTCGTCHGDRVHAVQGSLMNSLRGMVETTRRVFGEPASGDVHSLGHSPADELLRKLCVRCHLGHPKETRSLAVTNRGGGCLACHLSAYPPDRHPRLTAHAGDDRCFGCHSRSARISLNYAGLAEVDSGKGRGGSKAKGVLARLPDGRAVKRQAADIHHRAGMSCTDCHTEKGLKGGAGHVPTAAQAVEIRCTDCHRDAIGTEAGGPLDGTDQGQSKARLGTRLTRIGSAKGQRRLRLRNGSKALPLAPYEAASHPLAREHRRLTCSACHSQWAPLCYGCHLQFDAEDEQWDHLAGKATPGRWRESRWGVETGLPVLGVRADGRIAPFVPGMVMTLSHPHWQGPKFTRLYAPIAPHTIGPSRSCKSCHCDPRALGLGSGVWRSQGEKRSFVAARPVLQDGLAEDAWSSLDRGMAGASTQPGARPLSTAEVGRVLGATTACYR